VTAAETLRAAAKLLRETAAKATPGPWENAEDDLWIGGNIWGYVIHKEETFVGDDPAWIALAHPGLAGPLADFLEGTAEAMAWLAPYRPHERGYRMWAAALDLAAVILGEEAGR
jgi:hypothetical protein